MALDDSDSLKYYDFIQQKVCKPTRSRLIILTRANGIPLSTSSVIRIGKIHVNEDLPSTGECNEYEREGRE